MKRTISVILLSILCLLMLSISATRVRATSSSQQPVLEWERTYGGVDNDATHGLVETGDGGYVLAGWTASFGVGWNDVWLVKTDASGNAQWNKTYGGTANDEAYDLVKTVDGGYAIAGSTASYGRGGADVWLIKTDANGNVQWNQTYGGTDDDRAYALVETTDGGYVLAGETRSFGAGGYDVWLIRTDSLGNVQWNWTFGGTGYDGAYDLVERADGGYALAGDTWSFGAGSYDAWLITTDASGVMQWNMTYGGTNDDRASALVETTNKGYTLAGRTESYGVGGIDVWLIGIDAAGNLKWNETYGGAGEDIAYDLVKTTDGGYATAASTASYGNGYADFWLIKTDAEGNHEWNVTFGGTNDDVLLALTRTTDGGYALTGYTASYGAGDYDSRLIKLAPERILATINIDPDTLNLGSKGNWITAYVELPEGYDAGNIDVSTILLNGTVPVDPSAPTAVGDYDGDGVPDLMVKFDRAAVSGLILSQGVTSGNVVLTIKGRLCDGTVFEGSDTIRVMLPMPKSHRSVPI